MSWTVYIAYFCGGFFLANAIPHLVAGMMGQGFPSPFAKPPGKGLSSPLVNVLWGAFNLTVGYLLIVRVGSFDLRNTSHVVVVGLGGLLIAVALAYHLGKMNGTNSKEKI